MVWVVVVALAIIPVSVMMAALVQAKRADRAAAWAAHQRHLDELRAKRPTGLPWEQRKDRPTWRNGPHT